jgi:hypothetical protein
MKKLFVTVLVLLVAVPALAIEWKKATIEYTYEAIFDSAHGSHGVAVDKYDRLWSANYYDPIRIVDADGNLVATIDSLLVPGAGEGGACCLVSDQHQCPRHRSGPQRQYRLLPRRPFDQHQRRHL